MPIKPLSREDVTIQVEAEPEHVPVKDNASASGDDAFDREVERTILSRLQQGDVWAWAIVTVTVAWEGQEFSDHLGCCCYADEEDFRRPGGYFDDMVDTALSTLNAGLGQLYQRLTVRLS